MSLVIASASLLIGCGRAEPPRQAAEERSLAEQAAAVRDGTADTIEIEFVRTKVNPRELQSLAGLANLRTLLLDDLDARYATADLEPLAELPALQHLRIRGHGIDDDALAQIVKIRSLEILNVPQGEFTDDGLALLTTLPKLVQLRFGSPRVTDAGMNTIAMLPALKRLHLIDVPITDGGLAELASIEQLESLYLDGAKISDAGIDELFRKRPDLHVHFNQEHHDRDPHRHPHE